MSKKENKAAIEENLPMVIDMESDAGSGFENADVDTFIVPRIVVLQSNSPQVDDEKPEFIKNSKPGMLLNTATQEVYDGKVGMGMVICTYTRKFIEWADRADGGGIQNVYNPAEGMAIQTEKRPEKEGNKDWVVGTNNNLVDTREHAVIVLLEGQDPFPALMSFASTQVKKSKSLMTIMNSIKVPGAKGKFTPPLFANQWHMVTVGEENKKGSWKGYKFERLGLIQDAPLYTLAKGFAEQVNAGEVEAKEESGGSAPDNDGACPF